MILTEQTLAPLIKQAMREKAPEMYRELTASGEIEQVIADRATAAMESYATAVSAARDETLTSKKGHQESVQAMTAARSEAQRIALDQAVEFPVESQPDQAEA